MARPRTGGLAPRVTSLWHLDPATYQPSALHAPTRTFPETNCYVDVCIELLHASGINPASIMAFPLGIQFEGDQWTFFKPRPEELERLHGIDIHEMQLYRPTIDHALEQLRQGRTMIIEVDSFYLPDTAATAYRRAHVKTSIALESLDPQREVLRYFHGPGYWELSGDDFRGLFRLGREFSADVLPPYVELVRFDAGPRLSGAALKHAAQRMLDAELARRPLRNPWLDFGERLQRDLPALLTGTEENYHAYAFATVRQCGAAFESARTFVDWLSPGHPAIETLTQQVDGAKALLFKLARRRPFDPTPTIGSLAQAWQETFETLRLAPVAAG
jgi:hypothetical protein